MDSIKNLSLYWERTRKLKDFRHNTMELYYIDIKNQYNIEIANKLVEIFFDKSTKFEDFEKFKKGVKNEK